MKWSSKLEFICERCGHRWQGTLAKHGVPECLRCGSYHTEVYAIDEKKSKTKKLPLRIRTKGGSVFDEEGS